MDVNIPKQGKQRHWDARAQSTRAKHIYKIARRTRERTHNTYYTPQSKYQTPQLHTVVQPMHKRKNCQIPNQLTDELIRNAKSTKQRKSILGLSVLYGK